MTNERRLRDAPKKYPYVVEGDLEEMWRRMNPRANCRPPFIIRPENQRIRIHIDLCLHTMTLIEVVASVRERFGVQPGLTRCSIHAYCRDFWSKEFPRSRMRGAARHRRGRIRAIEESPAILEVVRRIARLSHVHLMWLLLARDFARDVVPNLEQLRRYVSRVNKRRGGGPERSTAIEQDVLLVKRIGELMRCRRARLIHEIIVHDFGAAAPTKPDTTREYLRTVLMDGRDAGAG